MKPLNFPPAKLIIRNQQIFDPLRKKLVPLTPEEWVRQNLIRYLIDHLHYPAGLMASEYTVSYNGMNKRADLVLFNTAGNPYLIIECKAPDVKITEDTFYQLARYASSLKATMLIMTNGLDHYCAEISKAEGKLKYLDRIPEYKNTTD